MNTRMNRGRLNIGTYILQPYARSEAHIRDLAECGIDFVVNMDNDQKALDLFSKYNVGAIVTGVLPGWWGGCGKSGQMEEINPFEKYVEAAQKFEDHPAIWGIDTGDEPSALDFPYYGKVCEFTDKKFKKQFAYLNLYPNYASVAENTAEQTTSQLGTSSYEEYINVYCKNIGLDYICYDFYIYSINVALAYANLNTVANACRNSGRSMWIVLQVNSSRKDKWITENQLRFQANSALAFGVENIIWACYTAGWWNNQVVDENGEKTEQYEKLRTVNAEIRSVADEYMKFRNTATHFIGFGKNHPDMEKLGDKSIDRLDTGIFRNVKEKDNKEFVCGQMIARSENDKYALFVCAADDPMDENHSVEEITFESFRKIFVCDTNGKREIFPDENGVFHVIVESNGGALIEAE